MPLPALARLTDFNLSPEAAALLAKKSPDAEAAMVARTLLWEALREQARWECGERESVERVEEFAATMPVDVHDMRQALVDAMDPRRCEARLFLAELASSEGDIDAITSAYAKRRAWEAQHGSMKLNSYAMGPCILRLGDVLISVFRQARRGDSRAKSVFQDLLQDLKRIPSTDTKEWLKRVILEAIEDPRAQSIAQDILKTSPRRLDAMMDAFFEGRSPAMAALAS